MSSSSPKRTNLMGPMYSRRFISSFIGLPSAFLSMAQMPTVMFVWTDIPRPVRRELADMPLGAQPACGAPNHGLLLLYV